MTALICQVVVVLLFFSILILLMIDAQKKISEEGRQETKKLKEELELKIPKFRRCKDCCRYDLEDNFVQARWLNGDNGWTHVGCTRPEKNDIEVVRPVTGTKKGKNTRKT